MRRIVGVVALTALSVSMLAGCSKGPADVACSDFLTLSTDKQTEVMEAWAAEKKMISGSLFLSNMIAHCEANPDDVISDLSLTGF